MHARRRKTGTDRRKKADALTRGKRASRSSRIGFTIICGLRIERRTVPLNELKSLLKWIRAHSELAWRRHGYLLHEKICVDDATPAA